MKTNVIFGAIIDKCFGEWNPNQRTVLNFKILIHRNCVVSSRQSCSNFSISVQVFVLEWDKKIKFVFVEPKFPLFFLLHSLFDWKLCWCCREFCFALICFDQSTKRRHPFNPLFPSNVICLFCFFNVEKFVSFPI